VTEGPTARASGRFTLAACALLALAWAATFALHPWSDESVGDLGSRSTVAMRVLGGALPYRDFPFEYPPLAAPVMALPGLAGTDGDAYRIGIAVVAFAVTAVVLLLVRTLALRTGGDARLAMLGVAVAPLLLGAVIRLHIDVVPVALLLAALVAILAHRPATGFALIGLGTMLKAFPLVAAPVALAWLLARGDRAAAIRGASALGVTLAVVGAVWLALSPDGAIDSVRFQLERPLQIESTPASLLFVLGSIGGAEPAVVASHNSSGIAHPLAGAAGALFTAALVAAVALLAALAARTRSPEGLVLGALAAAAAFAALGRVLSPQYLIWVVPLLALALAWRRWALALLAATACALTLAEFPARYIDLTAADPLAIAIVAARNAALVAAVLVAGAVLNAERSGAGMPMADPRERVAAAAR
jgi:uncharacterized membrane protein